MTCRVRLEPSGIAIDARPSERLLDLLDEHPGLGLPTACRAANCGLCTVAVVSGAELWEPPQPRELETLRALAVQPGTRLGCQLVLREAPLPADGLVVLVLQAKPNPVPSQ